MTATSVQRRVLRQLLGADRVRRQDPPSRQGYSVARRVLAGLLGVRLPERTGPVPPDGPPVLNDISVPVPLDTLISNHPAVPAVLEPAPNASRPSQATVSLAEQILNAVDRAEAASATWAALSPGTRLAMRGQPIFLAVMISDLLTRAIAIVIVSDKFRLHRYHLTQEVGALSGGLEFISTITSDLYPSSSLVHDLAEPRDLVFDLDVALVREGDFAHVRSIARDLARALALALTRLISALSGDVPGDLALALALARTLDLAGLDLNLDYALHSALSISSSVDEAAARRIDLSSKLRLAPVLLAGALDDFTQADLTGVELSSVSLVGILWSKDGTKWPTGTDVARMLELSVETNPGSGMYLITWHGGTERDHVDVLM